MNSKNDILFGRERRAENFKEREDGIAEKSLAARVVLAFGTLVLVFFFTFASFGKNTDRIEYAESDSFDGEGVVSVFSQLVLSDGTTVDNVKEVKDSITVEAASEWNLWQYLCDSFAELFGVSEEG